MMYVQVSEKALEFLANLDTIGELAGTVADRRKLLVPKLDNSQWTMLYDHEQSTHHLVMLKKAKLILNTSCAHLCPLKGTG